ncbi:hypothetical protein FA13DRAFT_1739385 [Coprinellus micaceus]|uniref:Uncharacterized protein n=1 Tax=Coprinellus micaceus TaxID=71717 RepID=A0A4Y7SR65_COPMI|nr:hypothetical protein FA13DRAFT_1739385 [Coprinellus micaceus]
MQGLRFMEYVPSKDNDHANHTCRDLKCVQPSVRVHPGDNCIAEETSSIVNCSPNRSSICRESGTRLNRVHEADGAPPRFFERQAIPYLRWIESNRSDRGERSDPDAQIGGSHLSGDTAEGDLDFGHASHWIPCFVESVVPAYAVTALHEHSTASQPPNLEEEQN